MEKLVGVGASPEGRRNALIWGNAEIYCKHPIRGGELGWSAQGAPSDVMGDCNRPRRELTSGLYHAARTGNSYDSHPFA